MVELPQNNSPHTAVDTFCKTCPKVYVAICYVRHPKHPAAEDFAFKRAGQTFLERIRENSYAGYHTKLDFSEGDQVMLYTYYDEESFINAWTALVVLSEMYKIYGVAIFGHHGVTDTGESVFLGWSPDSTDDNTQIDGPEIETLEKLNWIKEKSFLFLAACNLDEGSNNVAQAFFERQGVQTISSKAYSYFSTNYLTYHETSPASEQMYLLPFRRGVNLKDSDTYFPNTNNPNKNLTNTLGGRIWEQVRE